MKVGGTFVEQSVTTLAEKEKEIAAEKAASADVGKRCLLALMASACFFISYSLRCSLRCTIKGSATNFIGCPGC